MKNIIFASFLVAALCLPTLALAQQPKADIIGQPKADIIGQPSGTGASFKLVDPFGKDMCQLVKALLDIVLAIGIPVAVGFLVWAGFMFVFARGNEEKLRIAKNNFMFVILGIAVFLGAWTLATIIAATVRSIDSSGSVQFCGK